MQQPIKVLVADDQELVRQGVRVFLEPVEAIKIVGFAADGDQTLQAVKALKPDVLILDLEMPKIDGYELIKKFANHPIKIIVLSAHQETSYVSKAIRAGVQGYLPKSSVADELEWAIRLVNRGYCAFDYKFLSQTLSVMNLANSSAEVNSQVRSNSRVRASKPKQQRRVNPLFKFFLEQFKKSISSKLDYIQQVTVKFNNFTRNFQFSIKLKFVHFVLFFCCTLSLTIFITTVVIALD